MILLDQSLNRVLEEFALQQGEPREWVESIFHARNGRPAIVRHAPGHATHLHLRFFNPLAQRSGRRLMPLLVEQRIVAPPQQVLTHVARNGDTLAKLAARYGTTMQAIRQANSMRTYQLVAGATYRIPVRGRATDATATNTPARRVPAKPSSKPN
jgi:penicillin-insensitive murein endopeptidase